MAYASISQWHVSGNGALSVETLLFEHKNSNTRFSGLLTAWTRTSNCMNQVLNYLIGLFVFVLVSSIWVYFNPKNCYFYHCDEKTIRLKKRCMHAGNNCVRTQPFNLFFFVNLFMSVIFWWDLCPVPLLFYVIYATTATVATATATI